MERIKSLVMAVLILGALGLVIFHDEVHYLRFYEGTVVRGFQEDLGNPDTGGVMQAYMLEIQTADGVVEVEVPLQVFNRAFPGMHVKKKPFTEKVELWR